MSTIAEMLVALGINTGPFTAGMAQAKGEMAGFAASADASGKKASGAFNAIGVASIAVVGGVAAIGAGAVDMAAKYQESMTTIQINAHLGAGATAAIGTAIQTAAIGTEASANTMATALGPVAGELQRIAGGTLTAAAATQVLTAAQNLSEASGTDLTTTVKSLTDLMLVYGQGTAAAAADADLLQAAHAQLGVDVGTLSGQLQRLQPKLAGSGVDMKTVLGIARELEPTVGTGARAVLTMGTVLQAFTAPTKAAEKALTGLKVSLTDAHGKFIGFGPAITAINKGLANTTPVQRAAELQVVFGKNVGIVTALLKGGAAGLAANVKALTDQGTAAAAAALRGKELGDQIGTLKATVATALTALGGALLPTINQIAEAILPVVNSIAQWIAANPQLATTILAVVGGVAALTAGIFLLGPILAGIGTAVGIITSPITLVIGAVLGLAAHFGLFGKGAKDAVDGVVGKVTAMFPALKPVFDAIGQAMQWISTNAVPALGAAFNWIVANVLPALRSAFEWILNNAIPALGAAFQWIATNVLPALGAAFQWIVDNILPPVESVINTIATVILPALGEAFNGVVSWVQANLPAMGAVFDAVAGTIGKAAGLIGDVVRTAFDVVSKVVAAVSPVLVKIGEVIFPAIGTAASVMLPILKGVFDAIGTAIDILHKAFDQFGAFFGPLWDKITVVVTAAGKAIMAVIGPIIDGMKWVLDNASNILFTKPGTTAVGPGTPVAPATPKPTYVNPLTPGYIPGTPGKTPTIPIFQTGGIVPGSGPQLAIVHGGETIIPPIAGMHVEAAGGITGAAVPSAAATAASALSANIKLQSAMDAVTNAHTALAKVQAEHVTKTRSASDIATQVVAAEQRLNLATEKLALLREQQALPAAAKSTSTGGTTSGNASLTAALAAFTAALLRAISAGVPITLDGQTIGDLIDRQAYQSAATATSGFVAQGSIG